MKAYVMLAPGFEIAEATIPIDIMRRASIDVQIVSITPFEDVEASNGVVLVADSLLEDTDLSDGDLLFLPGGMPGATNLSDCEPLRYYIQEYYDAGKWLAAICAAPLVYGRMGLLNGMNATCYPGFEQELKGANMLKHTVVRDKNIITGCGPGAGFAIGRMMVSVLINEQTADTILRQMMFQVYA
ncbi:MAG: DJ-1/PfpI family protein [Bacteroidales bacterium]|nr:DJ-1/PfpI family protein [Bacteroidales bacterium]